MGARFGDGLLGVVVVVVGECEREGAGEDGSCCGLVVWKVVSSGGEDDVAVLAIEKGSGISVMFRVRQCGFEADESSNDVVRLKWGLAVNAQWRLWGWKSMLVRAAR
ncbi:hypothetical protein V6N11_028151 [Hibiscus sabdariffa]|uniref:Uncharacterized protein n=1 Tax=Hibiscus sabdariffa TaxID=183260 RepID=A0ABR1ZS87_9ROSI